MVKQSGRSNKIEFIYDDNVVDKSWFKLKFHDLKNAIFLKNMLLQTVLLHPISYKPSCITGMTVIFWKKE